MAKAIFNGTKTLRMLFFGLVFVQFFLFDAFAQTKSAPKPSVNLPKVTQVDDVALRKIMQPNGKPLLVNFWATWCEPCREEFPDLVRLDGEFKGKIDFITVSFDDAEELNTGVPKFLAEMKAEMPSYLLKTTNEDGFIRSVSKDWQGGLPFTILYDKNGASLYSKMGKVKITDLRVEVEKSLSGDVKTPLELPKSKGRSTDEGKSDAEKDIAAGTLKIKRYGLTAGYLPEYLHTLKTKYGVEIVEHGCVLLEGDEKYFTAYNETMKAEIKRKFGAEGVKAVGLE